MAPGALVATVGSPQGVRWLPSGRPRPVKFGGGGGSGLGASAVPLMLRAGSRAAGVPAPLCPQPPVPAGVELLAALPE